MVVEPGPFATPIWEKATARLRRRREGSAEPQAYDRTIETIDNLAARAGDAGEVAPACPEPFPCMSARARPPQLVAAPLAVGG